MRKLVFLVNMIEAKDVREPEFHPIIGRCLPLFMWNIIFFIRAWLGSLGIGQPFTALPEYDILGKAKGQHLFLQIPAPMMMGWGVKWIQKITINISRKVIYRAAFYAQDVLGADLIDLGTLIKSVTEKGILIKRQGLRIPLTHGDSYSVASSFKGVEKMMAQFNIPGKVIGIVGCYGTIGKALTQLFLSRGYKVIGMGRKKKALEHFRKRCGNGKLETTTDLEYVLEEANVVVTVTSAAHSLISADILRKDRVYFIYDVAQPNNLSKDAFIELIRQGYKIVRVDGGFEVGPSKLDLGFWLRLPKGLMYACFVEGLMQILEGDTRDHIGEVKLDFVQETIGWARKWGFRHNRLTCFGEELSKDYIPQRKTGLSLALSRVCTLL